MTRGPSPPSRGEEGATPPPAFARLLDKLSAEHHFDFRDYKPTSLVRRIQARMSQVGIDDAEAYIAHLDRHPDEAERLFDTILINITGFFRDPAAWELLGEQVMPRLIESAAATGTIRVWSAGASTGEEAYSAAILIAEHLGDRAAAVDVKIYGTDVDDEALAVARHGLYRLEQVKDVPSAMLDRYFVRDGQAYRFRRDLRRWCIFGRHNLVQDPPLSHLDLVICRNVLIYLKTSLQERLIPRFHYALRDRGVLFLGKSESVLARSRWFTPLNVKWRIFERGPLEASRPGAAALRAESVSTGIGMAREADLAPAAVSIERTLDGVPFAIVTVEADDTVRTWNQAAAALFEIPVDRAVGQRFRDLDVSYRVEGLRARMEDVKSSHAPARVEMAFSRRAGPTVHADVRITALLDERRRFLGLTIAALDVTEQARLREELARLSEQHATASEELQSTNEELETTNEELQSTNEELETTNEELQSTNEELLATVDELQATNTERQRLALYHSSVVGSVDQAIVVLDRGLVVTSWNPAAERLFGLGAEQAMGRDFFALPIGDVTTASREAIRQIRAGAAPAAGLDVPFAAAGQEGSSTLRLLPLIDGTGTMAGVLALTLSRSRPSGD
jgi:two-component system, chemotaxis family, CheB/CheR fusion protein